MAEVCNILATSRSCGNILCSYQLCQPGKITLQVSVLMIEYLVATSWIMDDVIHAIFCGFNDCYSGNRYWEEWYICVVKGVISKVGC